LVHIAQLIAPESLGKKGNSYTKSVLQRFFPMGFGKKIIIWAIIVGIFYSLLSFHFIFFGSSVKLLKKSSLTLNYTFFSAQGKTNESILAIDELREDGIGDLLVEMGKMSEEEKERLEAKYVSGAD
jgi:hypothetical protein